MYVVTVLFRVQPDRMEDFLPLMIENARQSLEHEQGCRQFDVCRDGDEVFLYEVYQDAAAFDLHLQSPHFRTFNAATSSMVAQKDVRLFDEVFR